MRKHCLSVLIVLICSCFPDVEHRRIVLSTPFHGVGWEYVSLYERGHVPRNGAECMFSVSQCKYVLLYPRDGFHTGPWYGFSTTCSGYELGILLKALYPHWVLLEELNTQRALDLLGRFSDDEILRLDHMRLRNAVLSRRLSVHAFRAVEGYVCDSSDQDCPEFQLLGPRGSRDFEFGQTAVPDGEYLLQTDAGMLARMSLGNGWWHIKGPEIRASGMLISQQY